MKSFPANTAAAVPEQAACFHDTIQAICSTHPTHSLTTNPMHDALIPIPFFYIFPLNLPHIPNKKVLPMLILLTKDGLSLGCCGLTFALLITHYLGMLVTYKSRSFPHLRSLLSALIRMSTKCLKVKSKKMAGV